MFKKNNQLRSLSLFFHERRLFSHLHNRIKWFQNGSMNITLKNVPQEIYQVMKQEAEECGRSLNTQIIQVLGYEAAEIRHRKDLRKVRKEAERFAASLMPMRDSAPLIRRDRMR